MPRLLITQKDFSKNNSFPAFEGLVSFKKCRWLGLFGGVSGKKLVQLFRRSRVTLGGARTP